MAGDTTTTIIGNLTADPEVRITPAGVSVTNFTVASTPRTFDRQSGEWKDGEALFLRCSLWRLPAENLAESLRKGDRVVVVGRLKQRSYEKDGVKHTVIEMDVEEIGASMKFATVTVNKTERQGGSDRPVSNTRVAATTTSTADGYDDPPPF